jgi:hypothetical protein
MRYVAGPDRARYAECSQIDDGQPGACAHQEECRSAER